MDEREMELKGVVACPVCNKEFVFVYADASGHTSIPCQKCKSIILVDCDKLEGTLIPPRRRKTFRRAKLIKYSTEH